MTQLGPHSERSEEERNEVEEPRGSTSMLAPRNPSTSLGMT